MLLITLSVGVGMLVHVEQVLPIIASPQKNESFWIVDQPVKL